VAVDLFSPLEYHGTVKKRHDGKGWGVMFVCTATSAVHIEFMDTYSLDSFLMAMRRFMCLGHTHENPVRQGRLAGGSRKANEGVELQRGTRMGWEEPIEWHLVPKGGQHFNRQVERMIGILKKQVFQSFEGKKYTHEETCTILQEAAQIVNSRPLAAGP
jgi:hypothetical protein